MGILTRSLLIAIGVVLFSGSALALGSGNYAFLGGSLSYTGLFRLEAAYNTSEDANTFNMTGDPASGVPINRAAGNPLDGFNTTLAPSDVTTLSGLLGGFTPAITGPQPGVSNSTGVSDTYTRYVPYKKPAMNYHVLRLEVSPSIAWRHGWSFKSHFRAIYDPGQLGYKEFDYGDYSDVLGGVTGGEPSQYHGTPNYLGYRTDDSRNPLLFERSGKNYMIDAPAFFVQWTNGNVTARLGNQSIAWGQLLFFRIMDQANGLDLRRHLILDRGLEEYADERESAPGLRVTWQTTDAILSDFFVQQFIPTILPNANTPYNVVDTRFTMHDRYTAGDYNQRFNYGVRIKADYGRWTWQAMYTRKLDQIGRIRFIQTGINKPLPSNNFLGGFFNAYCEGVLGSPVGQGCGPQMAQLPFEVAPGGLSTAEEWWALAGHQKLDGYGIFNGIVDDFAPVTTDMLLVRDGSVNQVDNQLSTLFMAAQGLRGHIERQYFSENVFGLGGGFVTSAEPGSIFDEMIVNVEAAYTPNRLLTSPDVRREPKPVDDLQVGLVVEKYQRFSVNFPATYLVFQYMYSKETDLAGLRIDGYGAEQHSTLGQGIALDSGVPVSDNPRTYSNRGGGVNSANYVVLAALQPTNAYIWTLGGAMLVDVQGGILVQPSVQYKPRGNLTFDLFYNYINDHVWGDNPNRNLMSLIDFANELTVRLGFTF